MAPILLLKLLIEKEKKTLLTEKTPLSNPSDVLNTGIQGDYSILNYHAINCGEGALTRMVAHIDNGLLWFEYECTPVLKDSNFVDGYNVNDNNWTSNIDLISSAACYEETPGFALSSISINTKTEVHEYKWQPVYIYIYTKIL